MILREEIRIRTIVDGNPISWFVAPHIAQGVSTVSHLIVDKGAHFDARFGSTDG